MLDILILQKNIQKEFKKLTKNFSKTWLWWNWVSRARKKISKIEVQNNICISVFGYENRFGYENTLAFPIYVSDQKFEDSMDLIFLNDDDKSHYVYIKDFDRFLFHKTKNKNKKWFCRSCLQCFSRKSVLIKHKIVWVLMANNQKN